ncbi:MAG: adenylyltransferase/cytidyltransferase family protein [Nanoarchaeota archaeon]|nr:adenylyltransferase/cytidyltransferase family protein [Nanoarchaeota archaeon]
MTQITVQDLPGIREEYKDKKIVFCSGSFDLTHVGHILFFEDCKKLGDILVVGVGSDNIVKKNKGDKRPILNEFIRIKTIDSLKPVDYCLLDFVSNKDNPLYFLDVALKELKPDIYVINEDAFDTPYREELCKRLNVKLSILPRSCPPEFEGISTTQIVDKVKSL